MKAGLDEKEANLVANASPMHDIGKVGIPDSILLKPGSLSDDEWVIMRSHSMIGHKVLAGSERSLLNAAAVISKEHHEKYDGTGYPRGLKGEEIPIEGRIVAVADVFDSLGSVRAYKEAWSHEKVLEYFDSQRGLHFDPVLVDILFEYIDEIIAISDHFKDH